MLINISENISKRIKLLKTESIKDFAKKCNFKVTDIIAQNLLAKIIIVDNIFKIINDRTRVVAKCDP